MSRDSEGPECLEVVVTADDAGWLAEFTRRLVEDRLVACGHVLPAMRTIYRWDGAVAQRRAGPGRAAHPRGTGARDRRPGRPRARRDVPCVIALPVTDGHPEYLSWVRAETPES